MHDVNRALGHALEVLGDAVKVEWSLHEHVREWATSTAEAIGVTRSEVLDLASLLAIRDAQMTGVPSAEPETDEQLRDWQRGILVTITAVARDPELWTAWTTRDGGELAALLG